MSQEAITQQTDETVADGWFVRNFALTIALGYSVTLAVLYAVAPHLLTTLAAQVVWVLVTITAVITYVARRMLASAPLNPSHEYHRMPSRRMQKWMTSNHA